jgi:hypothetical protein
MSLIGRTCSRILLLSSALLSLSSNLHVIAQVVGPSPARPLVWSANGVENGSKPLFQIDARGVNDETTFRYYTVDGTAKAGVDYMASAGSGTNWATIEITVPNDGKVEPPKTLKLVVIQEETPPKTNTVEVTRFREVSIRHSRRIFSRFVRVCLRDGGYICVGPRCCQWGPGYC